MCNFVYFIHSSNDKFSENRVRSIKPHPEEPCWIICSAGDEADVWSLESAQRQTVLWPSNKPPLTYNVVCLKNIYIHFYFDLHTYVYSIFYFF